VITLDDVRELDRTLRAQGQSLSANLIVRLLHRSKRDAVAMLRHYRAEGQVDTTLGRLGSDDNGLTLTTRCPNDAAKRDEAAPVVDAAPSERPIGLCRLCGYGGAFFAWTPTEWRCGLCGTPPASP
jgi:hypothetical protein